MAILRDKDATDILGFLQRTDCDAGDCTPGDLCMRCYAISILENALTPPKQPKPTRPLEDYKKFFTAYEIFTKLFGEELVDKYLPEIDFDSLVTQEWFTHEPKWCKAREWIRTGPHEFEESVDYCNGNEPGPWTRKVTKKGHLCLIPSHYQHLKHKDLIKRIFNETHPWLQTEFKCEFYNLYGQEYDEFYIRTSQTGKTSSLYVPYRAFIDGNTEGIIKRNNDYLHDYYRGDRYTGQFEELMETEVVKRFLKRIRGE